MQIFKDLSTAIQITKEIRRRLMAAEQKGGEQK